MLVTSECLNVSVRVCSSLKIYISNSERGQQLSSLSQAVAVDFPKRWRLLLAIRVLESPRAVVCSLNTAYNRWTSQEDNLELIQLKPVHGRGTNVSFALSFVLIFALSLALRFALPFTLPFVLSFQSYLCVTMSDRGLQIPYVAG